MILPQKYIDIINQRYAPLNNFVLNGDIEGFLNIILNKEEPQAAENEKPQTDNPGSSNNPFIIK